MDENAQPTNADLMQAIVALHAFTERGLQRNDTSIDLLRSDMNGRFDQVYNVIDEMKSDANSRFNAVDSRFSTIDSRFKAIDARFNAIDVRFDTIDARFDRVDGDLTDIKTRVTRLENHPA